MRHYAVIIIVCVILVAVVMPMASAQGTGIVLPTMTPDSAEPTPVPLFNSPVSPLQQPTQTATPKLWEPGGIYFDLFWRRAQ